MSELVAKRRYEDRDVVLRSDLEAAWLAGIIDGEGHIKIETLKRWSIRNNEPVAYRYARLQVVNCELEMLARAEEIANVGRVTKRSKPKNVNHRDQFEWQVCGRKATTLLELLLPYLVVKRSKAIEAIAWLEGSDLP